MAVTPSHPASEDDARVRQPMPQRAGAVRGRVLAIATSAIERGATHPERARRLALGLVVGGALRNLVNRLCSTRGVVDFVDVGIGRQARSAG